MDALEAKHKRELEAFRVEMKDKIKKAKKSEKAVAEAQAIQMEFDMKARHRDEIEEFEENGEILIVETLAESLTALNTETSIELNEQERAEQRKEKARRKKDKKVQKEKEKEETKAQILASGGGIKTARDLEIEALEQRLARDELSVRDILSDGHCLYRAMADQLQTQNIAVDNSVLPSFAEGRVSSGRLDYKALRIIAAHHLRSHAIEFAPFLGIDLDTDSAAYDLYCGKVESDSLAEWGGQLEIRALVEALSVSVMVYSADSVAPLVMGPSTLPSIGELKLSYHRHLFTLGEHYNSVVSRS